MRADIYPGKPDQRNDRPADPAGLGIEDLEERRNCCGVGRVIRRKTKQGSAAVRLNFDCFGKCPARSNPFKNPFELSSEKIGQSDRCSQNWASQQRLSPITPNPVGDGADSWYIEHAAISDLKEKVIGSRRPACQAVDRQKESLVHAHACDDKALSVTRQASTDLLPDPRIDEYRGMIFIAYGNEF